MSISWLKILVYFSRLSVSHTASCSHPGVLSYIRPDGLLHSQSICKCVYTCVCVPGNCQFWHDYLRRGPGNTAVPRYGCHSNIRRKWLTGRLRAVHVRSVLEMQAYASSSAHMLSLTSTTKEISHRCGRFMWRDLVSLLYESHRKVSEIFEAGHFKYNCIKD